MINLTDQIGCSIHLKSKAKRIISVVPSQSELLYHLELNDEVVGITKFCVHPNEWFKTKNRVGGTKTLNFGKIKALKPDLIIANKEENTQSEIEFLHKHYNVYTSNVHNLEEAYQMMSDIGVMTDKIDESENIINDIKSNFINIPQFNNKSVLYLIWKNPYMSAGQNTFINHLLEKVGFSNIIKDVDSRYDEISDEEIAQLNPDYIFLSSEPYPFKDKHIEELKGISNASIVLVDGEIFSWYGSRLKYFKNYINKLTEILNQTT
jgi:ABC-type Fe3+-hydroxamate transport system substrate-binding protein